MSTPENAAGDAQAAANKLVDSAQAIANQAINLTDETARTILGDVTGAIDALNGVVKALAAKLVG